MCERPTRRQEACRTPQTPRDPSGSDGDQITGVASVLLEEAPQSERPPASAKKTRRKLWDLPQKLHCAIIGTCLDVEALRKLARKACCQYPAPLSDYAVHVSFVCTADEKNALSLATHKALEKRYAAHIRRFAKAKTPQQLADLWDEALACGEVPGGLWATLTHPHCDEDLRTRAYEAVHMLSHQIGAGLRADVQRLAQAQSELAQLERDFDALYKRSRQQLAEREHQILELTKSLRTAEDEHRRLAGTEQDLRWQLAALQASDTRESVANLEQQARRLDKQRKLAERERDRWRETCAAAEHRAAARQAEWQKKCAEYTALERLIAQSLTPCKRGEGNACTDCPNLGGQRILCVGGRHTLIDQYRALVARCNGRFDHHDGGIEDNRQRLEAMLSSADAVVCTTDCVSHDAYYRLKRFCKRHVKPYVLLRSSGLSTFARALETVAG